MAAGAVLIACAGNGGIGDADVSGPGVSPLTISVGATTDEDARAFFSGTGSALDVVAPGAVVATVNPGGAHGFDPFTGTSAATPIVAGVASLLLSLNPELTHDGLREVLTQSADDLVGPPGEDTPGRDDFFGHGRVNLNAALTMASRCGNGVLDPGEACDTEADAACTGLCQPDCRCSQSSCTLENPRTTITTIGKGQSPGNNAKVSHQIAGHLVGGADAYGPKASRIRICEGTEITAIVGKRVAEVAPF